MSQITNSNDNRDIDKEIEISRKLRNERLRGLNDWIGFISSKAAGTAITGVGLSELISPEFLSVVIENPLIATGTGLALLVGRNTVNTIAKIFNTLKTDDNNGHDKNFND